MKKISLLSLLSISLMSCQGGIINPSLKDYQTNFEFKDGYQVLVLSDIHFSVSTNLDRQFDYLTKVIYSNAAIANPNMDIVHELKYGDADMIKSYGPDLIMLNGDSYMTANKLVVNQSLDFFNSLGIPFGFIHGNHDYQGLYGSRFIDKKLKSLENSIYRNPYNDIVAGDSNYVVNLSKDNKVKWQIFAIDCNTYLHAKYDHIQDNQVDWYKKQVNETQDEHNNYASSLIVTHIPIEEFSKAWEKETNGEFNYSPSEDYTGKSSWYLGDKSINSSPYGDNLFETIQELNGATKGVISAHDHMNITDFYYQGEYDHEVRLIYGVKSGDGIYHDDKFLGGSFYTLNEDGTFVADHMFVPYGHTSEGNGVFKMSKEYIENGGNI